MIVLGFQAWKHKCFGFAFPATATLLAIHPAWTLEIGGDCGMTKLLGAFLTTIVSFLVYCGAQTP